MEGRIAEAGDETGLTIHVRHYPPGTSKWNKIEHRLFCYITQNWRGRPLTDRLAIVELIGATTTKTGLKVECALDPGAYEKGVKVSDADMASINLTADAFHLPSGRGRNQNSSSRYCPKCPKASPNNNRIAVRGRATA